MVTVIKAKRKSAVLTPSSLACLSVMPTINLTAGCLHDCTYCYIRGYSNYPGEGRIILYEDTLERLRNELRRRRRKRSRHGRAPLRAWRPSPRAH